MKKSILIIAVCLLAAAKLLAQSFTPGTAYGGGIIIYLEPGGTWGLMTTKEQITTPLGFTWAEADSICKNLAFLKKGDWFLPSRTEAGYIATWTGAGVLSGTDPMWTSTESGANDAWIRQFFVNQATEFPWPKTNRAIGAFEMAIRPIRRFFVPLVIDGEPACRPLDVSDLIPGPAMITYGSGIEMANNSRRTNLVVGQPAVGISSDGTMTSGFGAGGELLLPPAPPIITATQGDLLDRIQISWGPNTFGAQPTQGYKLYRDGIFLASFDTKVRNYNDFNVIAGRPYIYSITGINGYGEGTPGKTLGYQVPNGVVTGSIQTLNGSPVVDAIVTLMPMQGFSLEMGPNDRAFAEDTLGFLHNATDWTITGWTKVDLLTDFNTKLLQFQGAGWWLSPWSDSGTKGVVLNVQGSPAGLQLNFPDSTKNDWNHFAVSHDGAQFRGYVNGKLVGSITAPAVSGDTKTLNLGGENAQWKGFVDELRIYHKKLDELDFGEILEGTASSQTPGLKYYWKMDEEVGTRSFDIVGRNRLTFCGAAFNASRPPVRTAGKTNEEGFYRIESASYGTGTTFLAQPMKLFYMHRALKFVRAENDYALLPDFGLTDSAGLQTACIELWANSAGPEGRQTLLSKKWGTNDFRIELEQAVNSNFLQIQVNGSTQSFSILGQGYQHLAFNLTQTGSTLRADAYVNGSAMGSRFFTLPGAGNWSDTTQNWVLGARLNGATPTDHFGGLIDEVAVYDTLLSPAQILEHKTAARDPKGKHLRVYFALDEGAGNSLNNGGSTLVESGQTTGTEWSAFAAIQKTEPHVFNPGTRQVTLNPSVTSVDQVDFTDRSTLAVSGFVRYPNTTCFANKVEILVNGESYKPAVYTDSTGQFLIDLDPGASVILSPKFEDHQFLPASWEITNISSPIAGVLFNDMTTRTVTGTVAGGTCKKSIIQTNQPNPANNTICKVNIRSKDGCYDKTITLADPSGEFKFEDLPPMEMVLAVEEHSDPDIETFFQNKGGATLDLGKRDTIVDFIYFAPPSVQIISGLDPLSPTCDAVVMDSGDEITIEIQLVEDYYGDPCPVDSANFRILNGFAGVNLDTVMSNGLLTYTFTAGGPNPVPPHLQTLQIIATTISGNEVSLVEQAVVTGLRAKESTFTTAMPSTPSLILRDPPGDGSYSFLEKGEKVCQNVTMSLDYEVGGSTGLTLTFSPEFALIMTTFGFGISIPEKTENTITADAQVTYQKITDNSFQTCTSFNKRISTSEDELIVGGAQGSDVFVGNGMNIKFGLSDVVKFDSTACEAAAETTVSVEPGGFNTSYVYSERYIRKYLMRYLDSLALHTTVPDSIEYYEKSRDRWKEILDYNDTLKARATYRENLSFDAGAVYEYSTTSDTADTDVTTSALNSEGKLEGEAGFAIGGVGLTARLGFLYSTSNSESTETGVEKGVTTGFVLKDNDPGDAFTVDVANDPVYNTPVFRTKTGQSSCPWEPGTAHREGCLMSLRDGSGAAVYDVPANEAAVYKFTLGNTSATNELRTYAFTSGPESNPHGGIIKLNGAVLDHPVLYAIPFGESIPITLTLERGPEEYDYDSLEVVLYSECEDTRAGIIGEVPDEDVILYSAIYISAHFIKPCSEVEISKPEQDWMLTSASDDPDMLPIRLTGYDREDPDLGHMRLQYRFPDGGWINIGNDIPKDSLGASFYNATWNTTGLPDGPYEIRALAMCTSGDAADKPGYSRVIKGRIERKEPAIIGIPEPADGVLNVGDEISVIFNKKIDCTKLLKADQLNANNIGLYNSTTDELIDVDIYCSDNKIELVPKFQNEFFENKVLRVELHDIYDLIGNKLVSFDYEFYVDRNELAWLTDSIGMTKTEGETKSVSANIHNRGGSPMPFEILGAPDWVRVVPDKGTLVPNEIRPIRFEVDSTLAFGLWYDSVTLHTVTGLNPFFMGGDEKIPLGVRVVCAPPDWDLDAGIHPVTMNMVVELNIEGVSSVDEEDIVAAFIDGELRGRARVQYFPSVDRYLAHLTIYGESAEKDSLIVLNIWDASACLRYGAVVESFTFQPENVVGTPISPQVLHTNSLVLREIPLNNGWNWISFNLQFPDPALNPALASLSHPDNDLIKGQTAFSMYGGGWFGSLPTLGNTTMYQYRADQPDTIRMMGNVIDPMSVNIPVDSGWNWLGYLPNYPLPINEALGSITAANGNLIKGQYGFAQYIPPYGWIGNLKYMVPPQGYQLKLSGPGTLTYPPRSNVHGGSVESRGESTPPVAGFWSPDPAKFENNMTLVGMLASGGENITPATAEIGAFAGSELRGAAQALFVEPAGGYLFFLTTYANGSGEQLHFKVYDAATGQVQDLTETLYFAADLHQGSIQSPVPFSLPTSGAHDAGTAQALDVQPNPFTGSTLLRCGIASEQEVQFVISDVQGREIERFRMNARQGLNTWEWRPELRAGVYFIQMKTAEGVAVRKVVKQ